MRQMMFAAFAAFLVTFATACGGLPVVEVQGVQFEGEADAKVMVPVVINGVVATGTAQCAVATDEGLPLCSLCVTMASAEVCQCFRGVDRVACPVDSLEEAVEESTEEPEVESEEAEEAPETEELPVEDEPLPVEGELAE